MLNQQQRDTLDQALVSPFLSAIDRARIESIYRVVEKAPPGDDRRLVIEVADPIVSEVTNPLVNRVGLSLRQKLTVVGLSLATSAVVELLGRILA